MAYNKYMEEEYIKTKVQNIIRVIVKNSTGKVIDINNNISLINSGLIDSLGMVAFIQALMKKFRINIEFSELTADNFDNIERIVKLIINKKSGEI